MNRRRELEALAARLARAADLAEGSVIATKSALWEVQAVRRCLAEVEGSLYGRLRAIDPDGVMSREQT